MAIFNIFDKKPEPAAPEQTQAPKPKILVVDDEQYLREFYQELLTGEGYDVVTAANGKEALDAAFSQTPDLIILDIMMPEMDGNQVLTKLRDNEQTKKLPVIVLTNAGNLNNMDHAKFYAANQFLIKCNITPEEMLTKVKEGLASRMNKTI